MKYLLLAALLFSLNSCNTSIGIYRDTRNAFNWTKNKFQGAGGGSGGEPIMEDNGGAPVY
jgi:hypothetical protein